MNDLLVWEWMGLLVRAAFRDVYVYISRIAWGLAFIILRHGGSIAHVGAEADEKSSHVHC